MCIWYTENIILWLEKKRHQIYCWNRTVFKHYSDYSPKSQYKKVVMKSFCMQQADWVDVLPCTKHHRKAKRGGMSISTEKREGGMRDSLKKWGTEQWNTYSQLPRKCCEKEEISKRIESESQAVCSGYALVWLGWCLSFFTLLSHYVNTAVESTSHP